MNDTAYQFITSVLDLFLWGGELIGEENLPKHGPAVFIANHLETTGPIGIACSIPLRLYTWTVGDMVDKERAPAYLNWDFVERQFHLKPPLSLWVATALSKITVPMLKSLGVVPVYRGYEHLPETLEQSLALLLEDKFLLIFPEDNLLPYDPVTNMSAFQKSFVRVAEVYYERTGQRLVFFPVAAHNSGYVMVGKPVLHNPLNPVGQERHRLKDLLEREVIRMYMELDGKGEGTEVGVLTPERK